eukprot:CAMPEP_0173260592 /NCGR_PEP_ID=MMETSP1142-20121109/25671_1 /TAXON_ID=483371 /ORGANISM="non described non described, Strain CCMP2298" /LENGTH=69 /DNA_ID=CAMNT_0014195369 /DNA_START=136 /DNA_END=342 /DNA_ORIENTATION=+
MSAGSLHMGHDFFTRNHFVQHTWQHTCPHRPAQGASAASWHAPQENCFDLSPLALALAPTPGPKRATRQ